MRIQTLQLHNFKAFEELRIDFAGKDALMVGVNGSGKTTVLSAIAYLFRGWTNRLNPAQGKAFESIPRDAITYGAHELDISCTVEMEGELFELRRSCTAHEANSRKAPNNNYPSLTGEFARAFRERYLAFPEDHGWTVAPPAPALAGTMPIFAYYGTDRTVELPTKTPDETYNDQVAALARAADNTIDFKRFFEWFREQEADEAIVLRDDATYHNAALSCVRAVIEDALDGVTDLRVRRNPTRLTARKGDAELCVDMLSDGEKCTLALFGDIARRLVLANPGLTNPLEGDGIVVVDEIEQHLHPAWQRRVLHKLKANFPGIQFILSTHSPQVMGEADERFKVFFVDAASHCMEETRGLNGMDTNLILESLMGTPSRNRRIDELEDAVYAAAENARFDEAEAALGALAELCGTSSEPYILAEGYLRKLRHRKEARS